MEPLLTVDKPSVVIKTPANLLFFWIAYFTRGRVTTLLCYCTYSTLLLQLHSCCMRIYYQSVVGALSTFPFWYVLCLGRKV